MEIRDYLRMLRRGWPAILVLTALFVGLAAAYLAVAPRRYDATTVLLVSPNNPTNIEELQAGNTFASYQVTTYAQIVDSATVLGPVAAALRPQLNVDDVVGMVTAEVRPETTLIDVTASGGSAEQVVAVANAAGESAARVLPSLQPGAKNASLVRVTQIRRAVEPTQASSPNVKHVLAAGLVAGLFVGLAGTIAFQTLDTRIRRFEDVRRLADLPVLAVLPRLRGADRRGLVVRDEPSGQAGDAYRALRTNLRSVEPTGRRSLVVAQVSDSGESAQVSTNLAWTIAQSGRRVLLVDLDLRRSAVGDLFGLAPGLGASDVLLGQADLAGVTQSVGHERLQVVLAGTQVLNPSDLFASAALGELISTAESSYDYVVLHTPAVLDHTDAAEVSAAGGSVLLTVATGRTRAEELTTAITALDNVRVAPLGIVLTRATSATLDHGRRSRARGMRARVQPLRRQDWDVDHERPTAGTQA
jgi:succinoglycan biosynthesis transport protein ExoP